MAVVVVADGSAFARSVFTAVFEAEGHTVVGVADGVAAVQAALANQPDAAVLAARLPRLSGAAAARVLATDWRTADLPVLLLGEPFTPAPLAPVGILARDSAPGELSDALAEALRSQPRGTRPAPAAVPDEDVLARGCAVLDAALLEATVVAALHDVPPGDPEAVAAPLLAALARLLPADSGAIVLPRAKAAVTMGDAEAALARCLTHLAAAGGPGLTRDQLRCGAIPAAAVGPPATVVTMVLPGPAGQPLGVLGLASASGAAYGDPALDLLATAEPLVAARLA